jgi:hypothetical protein
LPQWEEISAEVGQPSVGLYQEGLGKGEKDVQIGVYSISAETLMDEV